MTRHPKLDLTGLRFDRLTVIRFDGFPKVGSNSKWLCRCQCGSIVSVRQDHLRNGHTRSCGCYVRGRNRTSGFRRTELPVKQIKKDLPLPPSDPTTPSEEILFSDLFFLLTGEKVVL